jgi:hypothetical protein
MSPHRPTTGSPLGSTVDLPHLTPAEAYVLVDVLDHLIQALWDTYGDDLLDIEAAAEPPDPPRDADPNEDIAF